jgi:hypothetical protein
VETVIIERKWAMPNRHTFLIKPIQNFVLAEIAGKDVVVDPFSGYNSPATVTNDLNPDAPTDYHMDAIEFLRLFGDNSVDCVIVDPPYSPRQIAECYRAIGKQVTATDTQNGAYISKIRDEVARILAHGGKVIMCGWNSNGIGKTRGFVMNRILVCAHGGSHNDTIVTSETKVQQSL